MHTEYMTSTRAIRSLKSSMQLDSIASTWQRMASLETCLPVAAADLQCEGAPKKTAS